MQGSFFSYLPPEPPPEPEPHERWRPPPWLQAPDDELPAVIPMSRIIARTDQVVLTTSVVEVFSVGVRIPVESVARRRDESHYDWQLKITGHPVESTRVDGLRLGIELADGSRLGADLGPFPMRLHSQEPAGPVLVNNGGGGGGDHDRWTLTHGLWLWPLPPAGRLDLVAEWRAFGVPESRVTLDANAIRDAAGDVQKLWVDEPG